MATQPMAPAGALDWNMMQQQLGGAGPNMVAANAQPGGAVDFGAIQQGLAQGPAPSLTTGSYDPNAVAPTTINWKDPNQLALFLGTLGAAIDGPDTSTGRVGGAVAGIAQGNLYTDLLRRNQAAMQANGGAPVAPIAPTAPVKK